MAAAQLFLNQDVLLSRQRTEQPALGTQPASHGEFISEEKRKEREQAEPALQQPAASATSTATTKLRAFAALSSLYKIAKPIATEDFLRRNAFLVSLLFSAYPKIKSVWGLDANAELALMDDIEDGFPFLMVRVLSRQPDAYESLDRFDEEWWLNHNKNTHGLLNFTLRS